MAIPEQRLHPGFQPTEEPVADGDSGASECVSDDSEGDPTFDIFEETHSRLSQLSIKKKSKSLLPTEMGLSNEAEQDQGELCRPELEEKDEKAYEKVQKIIEAGQLDKLKVDQCKVYLRKHNLRLTGNKDTLLQRIREHLDVVNGGGETKYPVSSFVLNCKGDACTGDVVLFEQKVYDMYRIASRSASGPPCGTRTIAGRIVKESYGSAKQQHTFTVEVLWSKGERPFPPLHPLLIKGRNLYRMKTMRQRWDDERERDKALQEKHSRGSFARADRKARMQEKETRKMLKANRRVSQKVEPNCNHHSDSTKSGISILPEKLTTHPQVRQNQVKKPRKDQTVRAQRESLVPNGCKDSIEIQLISNKPLNSTCIGKPIGGNQKVQHQRDGMLHLVPNACKENIEVPLNRSCSGVIDTSKRIHHRQPLSNMNQFCPLMSPSRGIHPRQDQDPSRNQTNLRLTVHLKRGAEYKSPEKICSREQKTRPEHYPQMSTSHGQRYPNLQRTSNMGPYPPLSPSQEVYHRQNQTLPRNWKSQHPPMANNSNREAEHKSPRRIHSWDQETKTDHCAPMSPSHCAHRQHYPNSQQMAKMNIYPPLSPSRGAYHRQDHTFPRCWDQESRTDHYPPPTSLPCRQQYPNLQRMTNMNSYPRLSPSRGVYHRHDHTSTRSWNGLRSTTHYPPRSPSHEQGHPTPYANLHQPMSPSRANLQRRIILQQVHPSGQASPKWQLCRYYAQGRCYYGDNCKFWHD